MPFARRRILFVTAFALVLMLLGANGSLQAPSAAQAQSIDANAGFDPLSPVAPLDPGQTANPPRLYAGDISHPLPARSLDDPIPPGAGPTNGYCVTANTGGLKPVVNALIPAANLGFSLTATDPINPADAATANVQVPGTLRPDGTLTGVAGPAGATVNGDKFCVIAQAPTGYRTLRVSWTYLDANGAQHSLSLNDPALLPIVTVTLKATSIGNKGLVCTVGWDPTFLTGSTSNTTSPDPLNVVVPADFTVTPAPAAPTTVQPDVNDSSQWCASITGPSGVQSSFAVSLAFDSVYNRRINTDDQAHTVSLADNAAPDNVLNIPGTFVLAHIGPSGQILTQQVSPPLVIGSLETVCILGSTGADSLNQNNIIINSVGGNPDVASVASLHVFHATGAAISLTGGELCFSYTSTSAGEQAISAIFDGPGGQKSVQWTNGPLVVQWNRIDSTRIATSTDPSAPAITFTTITVPLQFNVADGTFLSSDISLVELVTGSHQANGTKVPGLLQGAVLKAAISGNCGYFVTPDGSKPFAVTGTSVGGRFALDAAFLNGGTPGTPTDLHVSILNDPGCTAGSSLRVTVDVFYPGQTTPALAAEYVDVAFSYFPPAKNPTVAWAGQVVPITYSFNSDTSCVGDTVRFTRPTNQRGAFLAGTGITLNGSGEASGDFGQNCTITANYVSADPGEVDIEVSVVSVNHGEGNPYSKIGFPIFYLALEDVTLSATPSSVVSTLGDVTANVRGYFVGTNPSGRQAETKPDGRFVPADRWVLPDDWSQLSGGRSNWGSGTIPPVKITFGMQNESVVNGYKSGVKDGGLGWFIPASGSNAVPEIGRVPDITGAVPKPRTFTVMTNTSGEATAHTFGDLNLSYEGCAANAATGNPACKGLDVVGHTVYTAVADYPEDAGKFPPIASNTDTTEWTWDGYKSVTIVNTDSPQIKYVVAHLRDRDGYCDAAAFNNELGVAVRFDIDSGDGVIIDAQGQPATISLNRRSAIVTSFDTVDDLGNPLNADITQTTIQDDECQAWIKISNSLLEPANVIVTFPAPPAPVPSDLFITALSCSSSGEFVTIKNRGANPVSLEGFALRSLPSNVLSQEEHLGLEGLLLPGQSKSFAGGPGSKNAGWVETGDLVFGQSADYARLVWNGFELSRANCDGTFSTPALPNPLPSSGEGQLMVDTVVPFGLETQTVLAPGWNLLGASSQSTDLATALSGHEDDVSAVYGWDAETATWTHYFASEPAFLNTMDTFEAGHVYWIQVKRQFTLTLLK